ncbi:uncharacterized protein LOC115752507 isoform X2 [Rhodamnia argentea]|uniref:Uncharacterized protein LOC115752507 isoform X2 n=1 Tax=Rhodamnia argentea TaxID=178133 RepID=A0ABM3HR52_9MYRT|nr:uncharacterized protein LOC115752507 isoform X2 [Rhodamnia argentea]
MFEGLVRQLLLGYLGRYVKDIQREQLKITLWNEEVLLENVELILEAFDYLRLPCALREGRVGRLSIRIPWKKLGWDPIIIVLEDVFVRASDRRDEEWSSEAVERREFAGKKAKLVAAELAKLSRRMCGNEAGQSFISYITAKILDSIQVSIRNVHILYQANQNNLQSSSAQMIFGLRLSSLKIMKQMSVSTKGQVHKVVEITGLEIYCNSSNGASSLKIRDNAGDNQCLSNASCESNQFHPILAPLNVSVSLSVNRPGKLDIDTPQWSVWAEITSLVICLDDFQLRQILMLLDNLTICQLREQYGRYRPWSSPLQRKLKNWQKLWWRYAQECVLSDVRKKLRKTSWRYFGQRISNRREYVSLYKKKLVFLQQEQSVDEQILQELEQMERASDIEDILSYRSIAECELQELLRECTNNYVEPSLEKSRNDERSSGRSRGWLNWLSRGMLGAGGTDDSGQFSGVVSDEVIKDIYEATEFHPPSLSNGDTIARDNMCRCKVKFLIHRISATLRSMKSGKDVAELLVDKASVEFTMWEESALATAGINSFGIIYPQGKNVVVQMRQVLLGESLQDPDNPSCKIQVDISPRQELALSIEVAIQPLTVVIDTGFFLDCIEFLDILESFEFQRERVLSSLDGIEDDRARILSKAEYVLSSQRKVSWNVNIIDFILKMPWTGADSEPHEMSLKVRAFLIKSKCFLDEDQTYAPKGMSSSLPKYDFLELQSPDLCDHFEVKMDDCEVKLISSSHSKPLTVLENFSASNFLASCAIMDKLISKRLEVRMTISRFDAHFSPSLYLAAIELVEYVNSVHRQYELSPVRSLSPYSNKLNNMKSLIFGFSIAANLKEITLHVDLENEGENNSACTLSLIELNIRYDYTELLKCWICAKAVNIIIYSLRDGRKSHTVCSFGSMSATGATCQQGFGIGAGNMDKIDRTVKSADICFSLDYEASRKETAGFHNFFISLNNGDLHCHPYIFAMMEEFFDRLAGYGMSDNTEISSPLIEDERVSIALPGSGSQRFGFSNFIEAGCLDHASIMLSHFPFVTVRPSGDLSSIENSLLYDVADWRNNFSIRTRKSRNPKSIPRKRSKICLTSSLKSLFGLDARSLPSESSTNQFVLNLNLCGVKVHFHDSSCIVGTVSLPTVDSAVVLSEDSMDILCSAEELVVSSSWWSQRFNEFLWGPSSENHSPVLNVRVKKGNTHLSSQVEVSIGIQHVCCILPPEYLAILIGYFSLPEWTSYSSKQRNIENSSIQCAASESTVVYKFEILDSIVILIEKERGSRFLKLEIPQFYCNFVEGRSVNCLLKDLPSECLVPEHKISKESHCLNIFGRQLSLSVLLCKDDRDCRLSVDESGQKGIHTLIKTLNADVWLRIPRKNVSTSDASVCIMGKIYVCELMADDNFLVHGFDALLDVINQLSSVQDESELFTSDVLQFLQSRRSINKYNTSLRVVPSMLLTEVVLSIDSLSTKLVHSTKDSILSEPVARAEMQFKCSASLRNETAELLNFSFSSVVLYSLRSHAILARCTGPHSASSVLGITYSRFDQVKDELSIFLPSLDIWLELLEWMKVVDMIRSIIGEMTDAEHREASLANADDGPRVVENTVLIVPGSPPNLASSDCVLSDNIKDTSFLIVKLENIGVALHFPIDVCNFCCKFGKFECRPAEDHNMLSSVLGKKQCKFAVLTIKSKCTELGISERSSNLRSFVENISLNIEIMEDGDLHSSPFVQIFKMSLKTEIYSGETDNGHVSVDIQCDHIDLVLSHQVFYFWHDVALSIPEGESSQFAIGCVECKVHVRKVSLLLTDGRWSCSGPLLEILMRNLVFHANVCRTTVECSIVSDLEANYNNIHKVMWEPFIEPWKFRISIGRKRAISILLNSSIITDIHLDSVAQLNLNITESFLESVCRALEMIKDAWSEKKLTDLSETRTFLNSPYMEDASIGKHAPYILQNLTSLPLSYCIFQGSGNSVELDAKEVKGWSLVQSGCSVPIYSNETPEEQLLRFRPTRSSGQLNEKQSSGVAHHFISIKLDGTSVPSVPISMDLVGLSYFEVDFSKASNKLELEKTADIPRYTNLEEGIKTNAGEGFIVPVVFDVSVQRFNKLIRLYSTVIVYNETSVPLELRFDIPLGVSPKIIDPIYPGQKFPLPLHLAEAGRIRWRPLGNSYVWSEPHHLPSILSQESKIGSLRSFVCYPSHPSSDPFRCCLSLKKIYLPPSVKPKKVSDLLNDISKQPAGELGEDLLLGLDKSSEHFIYQLSLSTPLVVHNYLLQTVSLTIESGGVSRTALLSEVQTNFHHVDPSHELGIQFHMEEFRPSVSRFSHAESFTTLAKFSGTKFTASETLTFDPFINNGPIYVTVEKTLDAFSGARELFIFVPYLIYNCVGFPLSISNSADELKDSLFTVPSCYELVEQEQVHIKKEGLSLLSCNHERDSESPASRSECLWHDSSDNSSVPTWNDAVADGKRMARKPLIKLGPSIVQLEKDGKEDQRRISLFALNKGRHWSNQSSSSNLNIVDDGHGKAKGYAYSPQPSSNLGNNMVRLCRSLPKHVEEKLSSNLWSNPFPLVPASGFTSVLVPQPVQNAAYVISATSSVISEPFAGKTRAITFQPRYVISNACSKELCYKQKGTDFIFHLGKGQHSHLHWADTARDLLVCICYDEHGWQWSGSFLPEILGDSQVKMRNDISGAVNMIRVEVQNADISMWDDNVVVSLHNNPGTHLILLSDDDSGYMPYRIENFSKERLRVYQQKCESFETVVPSYHSCPYAWDEPCYPHRLIVEVPGERVLGSYALDDIRESTAVHLPATSEKPERIFLISILAEGATKVLRIIDSSYHVNPSIENRKHEQRQEIFSEYQEKVSIDIPYIGISLINSLPQELLFACAKGIRVHLLQSMDRQNFSLKVLSLQIDNQVRAATYPVILSFNRGYKSSSSNHDDGAQKNENPQLHSDHHCKSVIHLAVSKWRKKDVSLISFEYVTLRVAEFHLELEQEVVLGLSEFVKSVYLRYQNGVMPFSDPTLLPLLHDTPLLGNSHSHIPISNDQNRNQRISVLFPSVIPVGAPWQQIYKLARRQRKIYVEMFDVGAIKFTLSFSSDPWMLRMGIPMSGDSLVHRGLMALADIEGARIYLRELKIVNHMAGWESIQEILLRHYTRQLLHEMYKVLGSAGVIGNPMGFARRLGLGIRDFLSVPARNVNQSPAGLVRGMAQGTTSLLSNTVYALSDAATQFSRAAQKGIVALTFDEQAFSRIEKQQRGTISHSEGVINEVLEGLTGVLQSPIRGAEKHGLPGVLSGAALGLTGLVARPAASILEVTGRTAQSIRNRSKHYQTGTRRRIRLPRPLSKEFPLRPYSWEEAIGTSVLTEAGDGLKFKDEPLVMCRALKQAGKFVIMTERLILLVSCPSLVDYANPNFQGIEADPDWDLESEIFLDSVIHIDANDGILHIVGSGSDAFLRQNQHQAKRSGMRVQSGNPTLPLYQIDLELAPGKNAEEVLQILQSVIERGKERGWGGGSVLHRVNIKCKSTGY